MVSLPTEVDVLERLRVFFDDFGQTQRVLKEVEKAAEELVVSGLEHYIERRYDEQIHKTLSSHSLLAIPISKKYGGLGCDMLTHILAIEKLGMAGMGAATFLDVETSVCALILERWGTEEQKREYLVPFTRGERLFSFAVTEPDAGSDPSALKTTYRRSGHDFVIDGTKYLISYGSVADTSIVFARSGEDANEVSAFLVDCKSQGFKVAMKLEEKVGLFTSDTAILEFEGCRVPASNLLGTRGKGFRVAYSGLLDGRLAIAAGCVGIMRDCLRSAVDRATTRVQHGKEIGKHQIIQRYIAELAMNVEMGAWVTYMAAVTRMQYAKNFYDKELLAKADLQATIAKRTASMLACKSSDMALQLFGGFGYSTLSTPGRHFLDSRVTRIYEGTDEILDLKIASMILGEGYESFR